MGRRFHHDHWWLSADRRSVRLTRRRSADSHQRSEEHTSELQSHRDLHSFPTRRSSDLRLNAPEETDDYRPPHTPLTSVDELKKIFGWAEYTSHPGWDEDFTTIIGGCQQIDAAYASRDVDLLTATKDRKSTRLNSSHTEIYTLSLHDALPIFA